MIADIKKRLDTLGNDLSFLDIWPELAELDVEVGKMKNDFDRLCELNPKKAASYQEQLRLAEGEIVRRINELVESE